MPEPENDDPNFADLTPFSIQQPKVEPEHVVADLNREENIAVGPAAHNIFQNVFARLLESDQVVRPDVYTEIGAIVQNVCERRMCDGRAHDELPTQAVPILKALVDAEIHSGASNITTLGQCRLIVIEAARTLPLAEQQLREMLGGLLKAVGNDLKAPQEQALLLDDIACALEEDDPSVINKKLIELLEVKIWDPDDGPAGHHTISAVVALVPQLAAVACNWQDLHFWTTQTACWLALNYNDDNRVNFVRLLELIEALSPEFEGDDFLQIDWLIDGADRLF
jgi:hypothetical protein